VKVSIIMAYYNRRELFINTLKSIKESTIKDIEVIVIDDASKESERLEDLLPNSPFLRVVRVEKKDKWWVNPCIPYNMGIAQAKGDIIILQNPECYHIGDVLKYITKTLTDEIYISVSAYAYGEKYAGKLDTMLANFSTLPQQIYKNEIGWYNHAVYCPVYYHFCSAITRKNMRLLGGFDERYAYGIAYDDNEFVDRVGRLGLIKLLPSKVSVMHQWHSKVEHLHAQNYRKNLERNKILYAVLTANEDSVYKENQFLDKVNAYGTV